MNDLRQAFFKAFMEKDDAKKAEAMEALKTETIPKFLTKFNSILEKNGKYFVRNFVLKLQVLRIQLTDRKVTIFQ